LPIFGESGSGKSCATLQIERHMPNCRVRLVPTEVVDNRNLLEKYISTEQRGLDSSNMLILVIDQYEEQVATRLQTPSRFVEQLSLLDRGDLRHIPTLVIWLTTSLEFQAQLVEATSRNRRILIETEFKLNGPGRDAWPEIIEETFQFHNTGQSLADYNILTEDLFAVSIECDTLGSAIESIGVKARSINSELPDLSEYIVVILWPVTNSHRCALVNHFSDNRNGYLLDWNAWFNSLNKDDRARYDVHQLNRTRLYFNFRLIPIPAASIQHLCNSLEEDQTVFSKSHLVTFRQSHFYSIVDNSWKPERYVPIQIGDSKRAHEAATWYSGITTKPTQLGNRLAQVLKSCGKDAQHEFTLRARHSTIRTDIHVGGHPKFLIELKVFSQYNTTSSRIANAVGTTLRKYAQFAGFA